jgi:hypothetical protein
MVLLFLIILLVFALLGRLIVTVGKKRICLSSPMQDHTKALKKWRWISILIITVLFILSLIVYVVLLFQISFSSPEAAFDAQYMLFPGVHKDEKIVIQGEHSAYICAPPEPESTNPATIGFYVEKEQRWRLFFDFSEIFKFPKRNTVISQDCFVEVHPIKETGEWFILLFSVSGPITVSDSLGSSFVPLPYQKYGAYIGKTAEEPYILTVDGESVDISYLFQ